MSAARVLLATIVLLALGAAEAGAHGTTTTPVSRAYVCRYLDRDSAPCAYAWKTRPQAMYDWMGILQAKAGGRHKELVPDGQLCSGGNPDDFGVFDRPSTKWLATGVEPGPQTFVWTLNAPHATKYYRFYITKEGWDPASPLRWEDLELFHDSGPRKLAETDRFQVDLPARTGRHVIFAVWQRSDSPEAFYACSDVVFGEKGDLPRTPPAPDEALNQPGHGDDHHPMPMTGGGKGAGKATSRGIRLKRAIETDWGTGYCAKVTVRNTTRRTRRWKGSLPLRDDHVDSLWNARHTARNGRLRVRGMDYNATLGPKATTTFGYCATRR